YWTHTEGLEDQLLAQINHVVLDKDEYLGARLGLLAKAIITVGMQGEVDEFQGQEIRDFAAQHQVGPVIVEGTNPISTAEDIRPSIYPISSRALSLGFPRVHIDEDGVRRQIDLLYNWKDQYYPQLGFAVILQLFQPESYKITPRELVMRNITHPEYGAMEDFSIPLSSDGRMYINWPHESFLDSFRHISFLQFITHDLYLDSILYNLNQLHNWGVMAMYTGEDPLDLFDYADDYLQAALEDSSGLSAQEYREIRNEGFRLLDVLLDSSLENDVLDELNWIVNEEGFTQEERAGAAEYLESIPLAFEELRQLNKAIQELRADILESIQDSIIVLGYTGESTTDIGVTPFESQYMNMGLHGAVINTILEQDFIDDTPLWISILIGLLLSSLMVYILSHGKSWRSIGVSVFVWLVIMTGLTMLFRLTGIYPGMMFPLISSILTSIIILVVKFLLESREKSYIKNAFGQYLSSEVIDSILDDPSKLGLGGVEKELTAIFTDVRGFSTISEQLTPSQLVQLLNQYLTALSDIILDHKGTIDKFEGDAIIAFFGAPHDLKNHALAAVLSSLQMKKVETLLNSEFLREPKLSPSPLLTRIGINTGNMVVGNMGTVRKMDYTIMGSAVNLAARLEGVNKQYNTWMLCSHYTYNLVKDDVIARPLDKVRVVGINEPVQLYNIIEEKALATPELREQVAAFERSMEFFRARKWEEAIKSFGIYSESFPDDATPSVYVERSKNYLKKPPKDNWDGVYNLTTK
ncbi:MAG: CHASE2 domain-containing protein, partial [Spirochaetaceae bacterium]|nr:CHASE2 domain-containing protein [Spirochaetaceae bacterium]